MDKLKTDDGKHDSIQKLLTKFSIRYRKRYGNINANMCRTLNCFNIALYCIHKCPKTLVYDVTPFILLLIYIVYNSLNRQIINYLREYSEIAYTKRRRSLLLTYTYVYTIIMSISIINTNICYQ